MKSILIFIALATIGLKVTGQQTAVTHNEILKESDPVKKEKLIEIFTNKSAGRGKYSDIYFDLAYAYAKRGNSQKVAEYAEKIGNNAMYSVLLAENLNDNNGDPALVENILKKVITLEKSIEDANSNAQPATYNTEKYSPLMASALYRQKKFSEALPYARQAFDHGNKRYDDSINAVYVNTLLGLGKYAEAFPVMDNLLRIRMRPGVPKWQSAFKQTYVAAKGSEKGYKELMASIIADSTKSKNELLFTWKNLNGKTVSLKDYEGKVIVFDFWATWCLPCIQGLPYMQKLKQRYRDDPDVVFLFVATREKGDNPTPVVKKFLVDRKLDDLTVLVDRPLNGSKIGHINYLYNVHGIPDKIVVGRNGDIFPQGRNVLEGKGTERLTSDDLDLEIDELAKVIESAKAVKE